MAHIKPKKDLVFNGNTTRGLSLGAPEGEAEENQQYYEDFLSIEDAITKGKFIISGRKGVGKSAFVKNLQGLSSLENEILSSVVRGKDILLTKLINSIPETAGNQYSIIYEWIILMHFTQLIIQNKNAQYTEEYKSLNKFLEINSGIAKVDEWIVNNFSKESGLDADFSVLLNVLPSHYKKTLNKQFGKAPFYTLIPSLRSIIQKVLSYNVCKDINVIIMFDDLDEDFHLSEREDRERLMELLRLTRTYNTDYIKNLNHRVIVLVRDDIVRQVLGSSGNDTAKLFSSYEYRLNWYNSDQQLKEEELLLRRFINKRISISYKNAGLQLKTSDPWSELIDNKPKPEYKGKTAFKFILDHTFYKPRDLIYFFSDIDTKNYVIPLDTKAVKQQLEVFSTWNMREIDDEIDVLFQDDFVKAKIKDIFRRIAASAGGMSYSGIMEIMEEYGLESQIFEVLLKYNYIVPRDNRGNQYFSYREDAQIEKKENYYYTLPKAIYIYFRKDKILQKKYGQRR